MDFSKNLYEFAFSYAAEGVFQSTPEGKYLYVNQAMARIYGYESPEKMLAEITDISKQVYFDPEARARFQEDLEKTGTVEKFLAQNKRRDGSLIWTSTNARVVADASGRHQYYFGFVQDVTAQIETEQALNESQIRYRTLVEQVPAAVYIEKFDPEGGHNVYISPQVVSICGYTAGELMSDESIWPNLIHPEDRKRYWDEDARTNASAEPFNAEYRIIHRSGQIVWVHETATLARDTAGKPLYWHGLLIDRSELRQFEETLRISEERFYKVFAFSPLPICITDLDTGEFINANDAYLHVTGFQREDLIGRTTPELGMITQAERDEWLKRFAAHGYSLSGIHTQLQTAQKGNLLDALEFYETIELGGRKAIVSTYYNITEDVQIAQALRESEEKFEKIFRISPLGICISTLNEGRILDANEAYCSLVGCPREQMLGKTTIELNIWESREEREDLIRALRETSSLRGQSGKIQTGERPPRTLLSFYEIVEIQDEACILSIHLDTTSQQEAQDALREIAGSYRGLFDSVSDAIYILDRAGRFLEVNRGAVEMYQRPVDYFLGKTLEALSAPGKNNLLEVSAAIQNAFEGKQQEFEFWGVRANGDAFPKNVRLNKGVYFGEDVIFSIAQDITEKKRAEENLRRREAILEAIAYASERFLKSARWEDPLPDAMQRLGQAGDASRIYLFHNRAGTDGSLLTDQVYEWCAPNITPQLNNQRLQGYDLVKNGFTFLIETMESGAALAALTRNLPDGMQAELAAEEILSIVNVPIFVNNHWWGFIGYDECRYEREWSQPEVEALKAAASLLGAVIERAEVAEALIGSEERYRILVEQASDGIFLAGADSRIIDSNPSGYGMLGYSREEMLRLNFSEMIEKDTLLRKPFPYLDLAPAQNITTECNMIRKDGSLLPTEINIKRLTNGMFQGIIRDITDRRKAMDAQERQLKELSVLQALAVAGAEASVEDEFIQDAIEIIGHTLYTDVLGLLFVTESGDAFYPHPSSRGITNSALLHEYSLDQGVTGYVARTGQAVNLPDVQASPYYIEVNPISRSELCVPMKVAEKVIGVINVESVEPDRFTFEDERLLQTMAGQIATAIARLRNERAERESRILAEALRDTAEAFSATLNFNVILDRILENIGRVAPSQTAIIMMYRDGIAYPIRHRGFRERGEAEQLERFQISTQKYANFRRAIETREPQLIRDTRQDPQWIMEENSSWIRSHLLAPILTGETVAGFLSLDSPIPGFFTERDKLRLSAFTQQAAAALENARLFESEQQRRREAETLREAASVMVTAHNSNEAINLILDQLALVLQYDSASVQLLREGYLEIVGGRGWPDQAGIIGMRFPVPGENPNTTVILERRPLVINSTHLTPYGFLDSPHSHILSWMGAPLLSRGEVIGMLAVDSMQEKYFTEEHIRLVTAFANQAALAIENARLYEQTEEQIRRLTSLRDIDTAIASSLDLRVTLNILVDQAMAQLQPDALDILIYNPYLQTLDIVASAGFHSLSSRRQSRIGDGLAGNVAIDRRMLQISQIHTRPEFAQVTWLADEKFTDYAGVPLFSKGQIKGVLEAFFRSPQSPSNEWLDFLKTIAGQAAIAIDNAQLFENLQRSNQELSLAYDTTLEGWGKALELRDKETEGHTRRVTDLTIQLARRMGVGEAEITHIRRGVLLHDIGKMGVPDIILRKPGPLNEEELRAMRQHPRYAYDLLRPIAYLQPALDIPYAHHEKWDGSGYPRGLKGTEIPLPARIFTVVDVWDALLSDRPYRTAWSKAQTVEYIQNEAGRIFDPYVVQVFLGMMKDME
ncbi:MAG: Anaerobic nitric oxide reductase transcription regulator NorR [Anaerolineales bacterium]|nr:Anaerobic nitric oxide reductase transcription regulator NorR [Anaerolineales bacterium]